MREFQLAVPHDNLGTLIDRPNALTKQPGLIAPALVRIPSPAGQPCYANQNCLHMGLANTLDRCYGV